MSFITKAKSNFVDDTGHGTRAHARKLTSLCVRMRGGGARKQRIPKRKGVFLSTDNPVNQGMP